MFVVVVVVGSEQNVHIISCSSSKDTDASALDCRLAASVVLMLEGASSRER